MTASASPLRILLVNDDGPPSHPSSPHILPFYRTLVARGHQVSVVLPSSQKSWGSMAFSVSGQIGVWWYYPSKDEEGEGAWERERRGEEKRGDEEWVLLDGSPTTCTNVGLFNHSALFSSTSTPSPTSSAQSSSTPPPFDLVLSGPNFGRNSGLAFCLSSGTLGAALAGSLSGLKAISVSYAHFPKVPDVIQGRIDEMKTRGLLGETTLDTKDPPREGKGTKLSGSDDPAQQSALQDEGGRKQKSRDVAPSASKELVNMANELTADIVEKLYAQWEDGVGVYGINVPLVWTLQEPKVYWTKMWSSTYPRLFSLVPSASAGSSSATHLPQSAPSPSTILTFKPEMTSMLGPPGGAECENSQGTDIWALLNGWVSVSRVQARFAESEGPATESEGIEARRWRL